MVGVAFGLIDRTPQCNLCNLLRSDTPKYFRVNRKGKSRSADTAWAIDKIDHKGRGKQDPGKKLDKTLPDREQAPGLTTSGFYKLPFRSRWRGAKATAFVWY